MNNSHIKVVNNSGADLGNFSKFFVAVGNGAELPEEIADLFSVEVVEFASDDVRVIVDFAEDAA